MQAQANSPAFDRSNPAERWSLRGKGATLGTFRKGRHAQGYTQPLKSTAPGTCLVPQWLRLRASNAGGVGSVPDSGARIPCLVVWLPPPRPRLSQQHSPKTKRCPEHPI